MSLKDIVNVLKEFRGNIGDDADGAPSREAGSGEAATQRMIIEGLIDFLDTV